MNLTPNARMATFLGSDRKTEPPTLPIAVWLEQLYSQLTADDPTRWPALLGRAEEEILWEKIISQSEAGRGLLKTTGTAHLASEAWRLEVEWQLALTDFGTHLSDSPDTVAFQAWKHQYLTQCRENRWTDSASMVDIVRDAIAEGRLSLPPHICLVGFEELTPQLTRFFDSVQKNGTRVQTRSLVSKTGKGECLAAKDPEQELRFAAHMAKRWLTEDPKKRIGIVVPDLEKHRTQVVRIFEEIFLPSELNIAAPIPLMHYPLIEAAISALGFLKEITLEKFSRFLRSPFFGDYEQERSNRARLDVMIRAWGEARFSIERVISRLKQLQECQTFDVSSLLLRVQNFAHYRSEIRGKHSADKWVALFKQLLDCLGWPGNAMPDLPETHELEIRKQWDQLLEDYLCLGRVLGKHSYSEALSRVLVLAHQTPFLPLSPPASLHILGMLEAVGIPFDALWITGLHREAWPPLPAPNPFIAYSVQQRRGLPRSSAGREFLVAKRFTERLCQGAAQVIFSYPRTIEDRTGAESLLLTPMPRITPESLGLSTVRSLLENIAHIKSLAPLHSEKAPPLQETEKVKGGAHILKLQANCPFRAFAEIRLQAKPLPSLQLGLSGSERGQLVHEVLQEFWQDLPHKNALMALEKEVLYHQILTAIDTVLERWKAKRPKILKPHYTAIERERLLRLIAEFIAVEKERPYFRVVAKEKSRVIQLEGLELTLRIDRIDQLENGDEILIDYKTGVASVTGWFGERPRDPQLPLYCVTHEANAVGVLFGVLKPGAVRFQGLAKYDNSIPGVKTAESTERWGSEKTWEAQTDVWRTTLSILAQDFKKGIADVNPLDGAKTCQYCSLKPLCRVQMK